MKRNIILLTTMCIFSISILAQTDAEKEIRLILAKQDSAWNAGNIAGFMEGYWNNDSLMFIGKNGFNFGWQNTLENYKKKYPDTVTMGKLQFEYISFQQLSSTSYFIAGKWFLTRSIGNVQGAFTLLFKKIKNKWVIVADHSS
jgi:ketosteroid isomerase-like protein